MKRLGAIQIIAEVLHLLVMSYATLSERNQAKKDHDKDEKIKKLEAELAELKKKPKTKGKK